MNGRLVRLVSLVCLVGAAALVGTHTAAGDHSTSGYWMLGADGSVYAFGGAHHLGNGPDGAVDIEPAPSGGGYWILDERGGVHILGAAPHLGDAAATLLVGEQPASLSVTPSGGGYWIFTSLGRVFPYGDAIHHGDMAGVALNGPVLDSVATPSGDGYWMVASDGGIFSFGDAKFHGSMGGQPLNQPVMSMAPDPDGTGYWLVASDGGIFSFEATFYGSMGSVPLNRPVSGMVPGNAGYLMVAEDGGIFAFGDVAFHGSLGDHPPASPVVAVALLPFRPGSPTGDGEALLSQLRVAPEGARDSYDRDLFPHWVDADGDSCDTREEVLIAESLVPAGTGSGCAVTSGEWFSVYDGVTTTDDSSFDIDHVVALGEAWDSGAATWSLTRRRDFANDLGYPGSLVAVSASSNRSKGDRDPTEWLPPRQAAWCGFATDWATVKVRWDLSADQAEVDALRAALATCPSGGTSTTTTTTTSTTTTTTTSTSTTTTTMAATALVLSDLDCEGEAVTVRNDGGQTAELTGWTIHDEGTLHTYQFPADYQLAAGASVTVRSGGPAGPGELHWTDLNVWNNTGDTAHLVDPGGTTRSTRSC